MGLREELRVVPGAPVDLASHDPAAKPGVPGDKAATKAALDEMGDELASLQDRLYAEGTVDSPRRILIVLQGMDTSGKGGVIKHVAGQVNPLGLEIASFKKPSEEELAHHFLWRIRKRVPQPGNIGIFDRSHYEDVLIVRVRELVERSVWQGRYDEINEFEREITENGVTLIKCFLHITYDTQRERLLARLDDPTKRWKFNVGDIEERRRWDDYQQAYTDVLAKCSTEHAPWFVVPSDRKWARNWVVGNLLLETLREMAPQYPERPDLDDAELKAKLAPPN